MKYIQIDIYGNCGSYFKNSKPIPCSNDDTFQTCFSQLINSYRFYLAFENSLCDDYITEKYWKFYSSSMIFNINIVNVVRGAKRNQYEKLTISNSFIFADDFETPKLLADYLVKLISNPNMYMKYFEWKFDLYNELNKNSSNIENLSEKKILQYDIQAPLCYLCSMLHNETFMNSHSNKIWKISEWFSVENSCWDFRETRRIFFWLAQSAGYCF